MDPRWLAGGGHQGDRGRRARQGHGRVQGPAQQGGDRSARQVRARAVQEGQVREGSLRQMKEVGVALIGHRFMGKAHSNAYRQVVPFMSPRLTPRMKVICGRDGRAVAKAARELGWEEAATDWREVVKRPDIDLVDISTPGDSHAEIAIAAARAGKAVFCEKPLANSVRE